ncbi:MAG: hypothetical protein ACFB2Z_07620 [Maricaulaceae bacterium]
MAITMDAAVAPGLAQRVFSRTPTAVFSMALGMAGLAAAWRTAGGTGLLPTTPGLILSVLGLVAVTAAVLVYGTKTLLAVDQAKDDILVTNKGLFFAPGAMALMSLGSWLSATSFVGDALWGVGACLHCVFMASFLGRWLTQRHQPEDLNPAWFLPTAGMMVGSMTSPDWVSQGFAWCLLGGGLGFWLAMFPGVLRRLIVDDPLPKIWRPSLFILMAPPALLTNSILHLAPETPIVVAIAPAHMSLFLFAALLSRLPFFLKAGITNFWWSTTFPTATVSVAFLNLYAVTADPLDLLAGGVFLTATTIFTVCAIGVTASAGLRVLRQARSGS